jgi:hypothetical protein
MSAPPSPLAKMSVRTAYFSELSPITNLLRQVSFYGQKPWRMNLCFCWRVTAVPYVVTLYVHPVANSGEVPEHVAPLVALAEKKPALFPFSFSGRCNGLIRLFMPMPDSHSQCIVIGQIWYRALSRCCKPKKVADSV